MADVYLDEAMKILEEWQKQSGSIASIGVVEWNASDDGRQLRKLIAAALRDAAKQERERIAAVIEDDLDRSKTDWEVLARAHPWRAGD